MKVAALIVGLFGAMLTAGLGAKWVSDFEKNKELVASLEKLSNSLGSSDGNSALAEVTRTKNAGWAMIVLGLCAIGAAGLVFKKSRIAGAVMIAAALIPALLAPKSLLFSFFLVIAGVLALLAKPKPASAAG